MSRVHINELFAQTASKAKKMRYFYSLFSENLRFTQNLPNEVFLTISDFKVDIPYTEILRISLERTAAAAPPAASTTTTSTTTTQNKNSQCNCKKTSPKTKFFVIFIEKIDLDCHTVIQMKYSCGNTLLSTVS